MTAGTLLATRGLKALSWSAGRSTCVPGAAAAGPAELDPAPVVLGRSSVAVCAAAWDPVGMPLAACTAGLRIVEASGFLTQFRRMSPARCAFCFAAAMIGSTCDDRACTTGALPPTAWCSSESVAAYGINWAQEWELRPRAKTRACALC